MGFLQRLFCNHDFGNAVEGWYRVTKKNGSGSPAFAETIQELGGKGEIGHFPCLKCDSEAPFCKPTN